MKRITGLLFVVATLAGLALLTVTTSRHVTAQESMPIFVKKIPPGYRDWKVVSVAHEAGEPNDIRAVLGNDIAIKAYREGKLPFRKAQS
jgi:Cytochrome P460